MISTAKQELRDSVHVSETRGSHVSSPLLTSRYLTFQSLQRLALMLVISGLLVGCDLFNKDDNDDPTLDEALEDALSALAFFIDFACLEAQSV